MQFASIHVHLIRLQVKSIEAGWRGLVPFDILEILSKWPQWDFTDSVTCDTIIYVVYELAPLAHEKGNADDGDINPKLPEILRHEQLNLLRRVTPEMVVRSWRACILSHPTVIGHQTEKTSATEIKQKAVLERRKRRAEEVANVSNLPKC